MFNILRELYTADHEDSLRATVLEHTSPNYKGFVSLNTSININWS